MTTAASDGEPISVRWKRRAVTIPTMLALTTLAVIALPIALPALVVADVARGRFALSSPRVYLFLVQYAVNDTVEILLAGWYWVLAGCGTRLTGAASVRRHERVQAWSIAVLARRAERLLGIRVEIDDRDDAARSGSGDRAVPSRQPARRVAPVVALPSAAYHVRGVIMAELLADPGFDLLYRRLGSIFIPRRRSTSAARSVGSERRSIRRRWRSSFPKAGCIDPRSWRGSRPSSWSPIHNVPYASRGCATCSRPDRRE